MQAARPINSGYSALRFLFRDHSQLNQQGVTNPALVHFRVGLLATETLDTGQIDQRHGDDNIQRAALGCQTKMKCGVKTQILGDHQTIRHDVLFIKWVEGFA